MIAKQLQQTILTLCMIATSHLPLAYGLEQSTCFTYEQASQEIQQEKKVFQQHINALTVYPDVATTQLVHTGVEYMRIYFRKLHTICQKIIMQTSNCKTIQQEDLLNNNQTCLVRIQLEIEEQKTIFKSKMLSDSIAKKTTFFLNKMKEFNKKFTSLLDILTTVQGEFSKLYFNQGGENGQYVGTQAPEK